MQQKFHPKTSKDIFRGFKIDFFCFVFQHIFHQFALFFHQFAHIFHQFAHISGSDPQYNTRYNVLHRSLNTSKRYIVLWVLTFYDTMCCPLVLGNPFSRSGKRLKVHPSHGSPVMGPQRFHTTTNLGHNVIGTDCAR